MTHGPRIVFMGTPDFAVPVLQSIVEAGYFVVGVVTQPDKPTGRKRILTPPPVKQAALSLGLPIFQPAKVRAEEALKQIADLQPDVCVTAAYGQLLPQRLLDIPTKGCLNVHASLLPRWRGAAPIHRSIMAGDTETGVTIMEMVLALDAGPVVGMRGTPISENDNVGSLHDRLARIGAELLLEVLPGYLSGEIVPKAQPEDGVTYAERILRDDEFIHWGNSSSQIHNHVRGLDPWPGATTTWQGTQMKIWSTEKVQDDIASELPRAGTVGQVSEHNGMVYARTGDGWIGLREIQPGGKRRMDAAAWFRGVQRNTITLGDEIHSR